jgi:dCMP deaminase
VVLPLTGSTIYATQFPCPRCVQSIIQVGIRRVVYLEKKPHQVAQIAAANKMLADAGIDVQSLGELEQQSPTWSEKLERFIRDSREPGAPEPAPGDI